MAQRRWIKDPSAVLDYIIDWEEQLGVDTIVSSSWTASDGITINSSNHAAATATVWLEGGTVGNTYTVTNEIVTAGGRTDNHSIYIEVKER